MEEFTAKCDICGATYDNYMRTFYIQYSEDNKDRKCCCMDCWHKEATKKPHRYTNHIPSFCDGGDLVTILFDSKEELITWLRENLNLKENEELCCSDDGNIITVNLDKKFWWVEGSSSLTHRDLPDWKDVVIKYHGNIYD